LVQSKLLAADPSYTGFATDRKVAYSTTLRQEIQKISQEISDRIWGG
jgi:chromosome partitioning protein